MPGKTAISWATDTWNLAWGCDKISPGCANCYIANTPPLRQAGMTFKKGHMPLVLHPDRLDVPLHWTKPRRIFVNSLSDMFHEDMPWDLLARAYATMALAHWHVFMVLTKRPERMRDTLTSHDFWCDVAAYMYERSSTSLLPDASVALPNVWHGVTVENRAWAKRADVLRNTPSAIRFISAEPLLGPLLPVYTLQRDPYPRDMQTGDPGDLVDHHHWYDEHDETDPGLDLTGIDWIIFGGESGPKARPLKEAWMRDVIYRARNPRQSVFGIEEAKPTAVHVKQMGSVWAKAHGVEGKAERMSEWPDDLRIQEYPETQSTTDTLF